MDERDYKAMNEELNPAVNETSFNVTTYTTYSLLNDNTVYCHWSEGLNMIIEKNGLTIKLNSEEIQKIVKSLPRTLGGSYQKFRPTQFNLKIMYEIKMKFWCNAGHTEEEVNVPIYENCGTEDEQIQDYFETWLDNNEDVGYERLP